MDCSGPELSLTGNKARKLDYYLSSDFPGVTRVISYGSVQSNMLYSLSILAKIKSWALEFYVDHIPNNLSSNPRGNYAAALALGADVRVAPRSFVENESGLKKYVQEEVLIDISDAIYISEGAASGEAERGLEQLAEEIELWVRQSQIEHPKLMLASGTGTTAYFLQQHLPFEVLTCACVGSAEYLYTQFSMLAGNKKNYPTILSELSDSEGCAHKFQFGKLYRDLFLLWQEVRCETGVTFDLLYDPIGWKYMIAYLESKKVKSSESTPEIIYLHQGGLLGNETMLQRYERKFGFGAL